MARYFTETNRAWIKQAAKELGRKEGDIVDMALAKLREESWDAIRADVSRKKLQGELDQINAQRKVLSVREEAIETELARDYEHV